MSSRRQTMSKQSSVKRKSKAAGALVLDEVFGGGGGDDHSGGGLRLDDDSEDNLKLNLEESSSSESEELADPAAQAKKLQDKAHARAMRALELCETASAGGSIKRDKSFRNPKSSRRSTMNPNGSGSNLSSPKPAGRKSVMADFLNRNGSNHQQQSSPIRGSGRSDHSRGSRSSIGSRNGTNHNNSSSGMFSIGENSGDESEDDDHHPHSKKGFLDLSFGGDESERSDIIGAYTSALTNDALNDVTLEGNDGVKVGANRAILASKNRVFQRLLLGSFVMTAEGSFRSVKINFRGKVLRAVVEFVLTDNTKVLDIRDKEEIKKQTAQAQAKAQAQQQANKRRGLFGFFGGGNVSSNSSIRSTSTHGTRSSAASSQATYTRPQIMTLVSLTRAAVFFKIPALGIQARDTLKHFLQRSPVSSFCVFEACRQEPEAVPKEIVGVALSGIRNYVGYPNIKTESVDFLSPPTMMEILQDEKLRMDDYQLFQIVQRWASSKENISIIGTMGGNSKLDDQTEATAATATETEGSDDEQNNNHSTPRRSNSSTNKENNGSSNNKSKSISCRERKQMAMNLFMPLIRLECIDPPVLATSVANSSLITQEQLLRAFQQQALAAHLRANLAFQRPRTTDARWKGSMSNLFISRFDNEFKEDVVNDYPPIQDGIHQWTINVEESQDFTWLGICITKYLVEDMDASSTENDPDAGGEEEDVGAIRQDQQWVYSNQGEALHGGKVVDLGGGRTLPFYGTGAQITFTLYLHWKDHGTLIANVDGGRDFVIFSNLRKCLQEGGGEGFVPMVSMYSPGSVRLVDIRHVRQTPFVLERLSNAVGSAPVRSSLSEKDLEEDIKFLNSALRSTRR